MSTGDAERLPSDTAYPSAREASPAAARGGGVLVMLLGLTNLVLAGLAAFTGSIRFDDATAAGLGGLGLVTLVLGVFVARGRRWAITLALLVFGALFVLQAFGATGGATTPAVITLAIVVLPLVLALRATRAAAPPGTGPER